MSMRIGESAFNEVSRQVAGLMRDNQNSLHKAWVNCADEDLSIAFKVKIKPLGDKLFINTEISFTVEKLKDTASGRADDMPLFEENPHDKRCRIHTRWMVLGGEKKKGAFGNFLKMAA